MKKGTPWGPKHILEGSGSQIGQKPPPSLELDPCVEFASAKYHLESVSGAGPVSIQHSLEPVSDVESVSTQPDLESVSCVEPISTQHKLEPVLCVEPAFT